MRKRIMIYLAVMLLTIGVVALQANAESVDLELSIVVDVSGSIDTADFNLQKSGYVNAFKDPTLINKIMSGGTYHAIAVNFVYFSDNAQQAIPWTLINDASTSAAFANAIAAYARPSSGGTGVVNALNFAYPLFTSNGYEGTRLVIDVSGDGSEGNACDFANPNCVPLQNARDAALAAGITTINGIAIYDRTFYGESGATINALDYLENNLIGGTGAFAMKAETWSDFDGAIRSKLAREIIPTPEPTTMLLLGLGLLRLAGVRRKIQK